MKPQVYKLKKIITDAHEMLDFIREISQEMYSLYGSEVVLKSLINDSLYKVYETDDYEYIAIDLGNMRVAEYKRCRG